MKRKPISATIKGVEFVQGKFHPFVERHVPCRVPVAELRSNCTADHGACTIAQRFLGPGFATIREAAAAAERVDVTMSSGELANFTSVGS